MPIGLELYSIANISYTALLELDGKEQVFTLDTGADRKWLQLYYFLLLN